MPLLPSAPISSRPSRSKSTPPSISMVGSGRVAASVTRRAIRIPGWSESYGRIRPPLPPAVVHDPYLDGAVHKSGLEVFYTPELLRMVLMLGDWHTIMAMSRTSQYARYCAQMAVRALLEELLEPFIPRNDFIAFVRMMDVTGCGVIGSLARRLLYTNSKLHLQALVDDESKFNASNDLNIVVPKGRIDEVKAWFLERGVSSFNQEATQFPYKSVVTAVYRGKRPRVGDVPSVTIRLSHSDADIFQVVVASPFTAQANLITSTRVYCAYPHLATSRHALRSNWPHIRGVVRSIPSSFESRTDNSMWKAKGACMKYCPSLQRVSVGDTVTASFLWNARYPVPTSRFEHTDSLLANNVVSWRLASRCLNTKCKNFDPSP